MIKIELLLSLQMIYMLPLGIIAIYIVFKALKGSQTNIIAPVLGAVILIHRLLTKKYKTPKPQTVTWSAMLSDPWFDHVLNGKKTLEGRRYYDKWTQMRAGDRIVFNHVDDNRVPFIRYVVTVQRFATFLEALQHFNKHYMLDSILPGIKTPEEGAERYLKFVRQETQERDGVVVLGLSDSKN